MFERAFFEVQVRLTSIFGDKKTEKGAVLNAKNIVLFIRCIKSPNGQESTKSK